MSLLRLVEQCRKSHDFAPLCEAIPYARFLGISAAENVGQLQARLAFKPSNIGNPRVPALHGGVVGAFLETTAVLTLLLSQESQELPKIINITVDYLRPASPVDTFAEGLITRQGRRIANVAVEAWQDRRERLVATANCRFLLRGPSSD